MKKQGCLALALLTISASSLADMGGARCDGFYAGLGVGLSSTTARLREYRSLTTSSAIISPEDGSITSSISGRINQSNPRVRKNKPLGAIYGGYGATFCDNFYLGAELTISTAKKRTDFTDSSIITTFPGLGFDPAILPSLENFFQNTNVRLRRWDAALDIRPGVWLGCNTLLYARLGVVSNRLRVTQTVAFISNDQFLGQNLNLSATNTTRKNRWAPKFGLGIEQIICPNVFIRADYAYTRYRKARISAVSTTSMVLPPAIFPTRVLAFTMAEQTQVKAQHHAVMLGMGYHW